jgi:hypothetical protein
MTIRDSGARLIQQAAEAAAAAPARRDAMPHGDLLASYVALLCVGKSDFEAIDAFRNDPYFLEGLGLVRAPLAASLRQRLDVHAEVFKDIVIEASVAFLRRSRAPIGALANGVVVLDADVTPMAAYLGQEGYCLELELREGSQCRQRGPRSCWPGSWSGPGS